MGFFQIDDEGIGLGDDVVGEFGEHLLGGGGHINFRFQISYLLISIIVV